MLIYRGNLLNENPYGVLSIPRYGFSFNFFYRVVQDILLFLPRPSGTPPSREGAAGAYDCRFLLNVNPDGVLIIGLIVYRFFY